jgi:archaellum component FlaC
MDESANHIALRSSQPGAADRVREESLPEQIRSISAQIKPIAELPALWADLGVVSENVDQLLPRLQGAYDMIAQAWEALRAQEQRLAGLHEHGLKLQQSMDSAAGRFSRLDKAMTELSQRAGYPDKELSAVKGRIDQGLTALDAKLTGTDGKVGALANRIDRLDDHIGDTDDTVGLVNERIGSINDRIGSISDRIGSIDGHMAIVDERTAPLDGRLGALETTLIEAVDGRMAAISGQFTGKDGTIKAFGERLFRHRRPARR